MFFQLACLIVDPDDANRQELAGFLRTSGCAVQGTLGGIDQIAGYLARSDKPQICVVNLDPGSAESLRALTPVIRGFPEVAFFVMSQVLDPNLLMDAMHSGVKEFIPLPVAEAKFTAALERIATGAGQASKGKVINVVPTMGGVGSTTIACNLAASLAAQKHKTVLIDLDLMRGAAAGNFDLRPRYTIADVMQNADSIDRQVLDNALAIHAKSGLAILGRPELPEDSQRVQQAGFNRLLGVLTRMFDYVVVDSMMSVDPLYAGAVQASFLTLVVGQLNVPSAKNAERYVGMLRRMGLESSKIKFIANRYVKKGWDIEPHEVERALGLKISWLVPNDFKNAIAAINYGEPVVLRTPKCEMSQSLNDLAGMIVEQSKGTSGPRAAGAATPPPLPTARAA